MTASKIQVLAQDIASVDNFYFTVPTELSVLDMPLKESFCNNYKILSENPIVRDIPMADGTAEKLGFLRGQTRSEMKSQPVNNFSGLAQEKIIGMGLLEADLSAR